MNKEQLDQIHTKFEKAARSYCQKSGIDPDERLQVTGQRPRIAGIPAPILKIERWRLVAEELCDLSMRLVSLREGKEQPKVVTQ